MNKFDEVSEFEKWFSQSGFTKFKETAFAAWEARAALPPAHIEDGEVDFAQAVTEKIKDAYHERESITEVATAIVAQHQRIVAALSAPPAAGVPEECHCDGQKLLVGGGCPVCNLKDEIHQLAFETGATDEDGSAYWFDMSEFDTFIERLRPLLASAPTPPQENDR